jgi:hypothetical protein
MPIWNKGFTAILQARHSVARIELPIRNQVRVPPLRIEDFSWSLSRVFLLGEGQQSKTDLPAPLGQL